MRKFIKNNLLLLAPKVIKERVFKNYKTVQWKNISYSEFDAELLLLEFLLTKDDTFFDIGANRGEYAYFAEKLIAPQQIYLFEPEKKLNKQLNALFKNCKVFDIALSEKKGKHLFKIPLINGVVDDCLSSLEIENKEQNETEAIVYEVMTDTLDNFTSENKLKPNLIKIDVEGHELAVLKGAETYIDTNHPTLIIEIEQRHHSTTSVDTIFKEFENKGYNCFYFSKKMKQLYPYSNQNHLTNSLKYFGKIEYINNYIFIHQSNKTIASIDEINKQIAIKVKGE